MIAVWAPDDVPTAEIGVGCLGAFTRADDAVAAIVDDIKDDDNAALSAKRLKTIARTAMRFVLKAGGIEHPFTCNETEIRYQITREEVR